MKIDQRGEMKNCIYCNREYDPSMEFVEDVQLLEAMDYFIDIENVCPECIYDIRDEFEKHVEMKNNGNSKS